MIRFVLTNALLIGMAVALLLIFILGQLWGWSFNEPNRTIYYLERAYPAVVGEEYNENHNQGRV